MKIQINNIAPNGMKEDIITLTQVPNADNSGVEYLIHFQQMDFLDIEEIGTVDLMTGTTYFNGGSMSFGGLKLLG